MADPREKENIKKKKRLKHKQIMAGFIAIKQAALNIVRIQKIEQIYNLFWKMLASRRIDMGSVLKNTLPPERVEGVSLCGVHAWGNQVHISYKNTT